MLHFPHEIEEINGTQKEKCMELSLIFCQKEFIQMMFILL